MIVVFPLTAQIDYTELKYSLRSLEKFLTGEFEIVVVGSIIPEWLTNVTQIEIPDVPGRNNFSVRRKIIAACIFYEEFFYMNDDFYLLKATDPKTFPYYTSGTLDKKGESGAKPLTKELTKFDKPLKYFGHYPSMYRNNFKEVINNFTEDCVTKSAYLNFIEVETIETEDCKIMTARKPKVVKEIIKDLPCFSTGVYSLNACIPVLNELFPKPSNFEI